MKPLSNPFGIKEDVFAYPQKTPINNPFPNVQQIQEKNTQDRHVGYAIGNNFTADTDLQGSIDLKDENTQFIQQKQEQSDFIPDEFNEPPLIEDLDITDPILIKRRVFSVLLFQSLDQDFIENPDLSGPFLLCILLGFLVMLTGKLHFNYIYGFGISGQVFIYFIMNFMSQDKLIDFYKVLSILGYGLSPVVLVAFINVFINMKGSVGFLVSFISIIWATISASKTFDHALGLENRKFLIGYPIFLFYFTFILISIL